MPLKDIKIRNRPADPEDAGLLDSGDEEDEVISGAEAAPEAAKRIARRAIFSDYVIKCSKTITRDELDRQLKQDSKEDFSVKTIYANREKAKVTSPREYQLEIFERAKQQNVIAVLDTGSGKTHIAVLLLRHTMDQELQDRANGKPRRIAFFLVDSVALVMQQGAVLVDSLAHNVARFSGAMRTDLWEMATWKKHFYENEVIVCTAEILHQCLFRSFIKIDQICLLIFDEAHHAKKKHPYARIMEFYRHAVPNRRPKVLGMTASPVDVKADDLTEAANDLETLLDSQIITASDLNLLRTFIARPKEIITHYDPPRVPFETALHRKVINKFSKVSEFRHLFETAKQLTAELGPWCADVFWKFALSEKQIKKKQNRLKRMFNKAQDPADDSGKASLSALDEQIKVLEDALEMADTHDFGPPMNNLNSLSNKVMMLHEILQQYFGRPNNFRCIVFVEQRSTAKILREVFDHLGGEYLRAASLTGMNADNEADARTTFYEQHSTLAQFHDGRINCLFATSIAEEGLDIRECNLIVRFDLPKTMIQYIQSRGRARQKESTYVFMVEQGDWEQNDLVRYLHENEETMRQFCGNLPQDRLLQGNDDLDEDDNHRGIEFTDPTTGARLTYATSLNVLDHFAALLPHEGDDLQSAQYYIMPVGSRFQCEVVLPSSSPIRSAKGTVERRKALAKRSAAFNACLELRKKGYIDGYLLPTYRTKVLPEFRNAQLAVSSKKMKGYPMMTKPSIWEIGRGEIPEKLYVTALDVSDGLERPHFPLALLTRERLPDVPEFPLFLTNGKITRLKTRSLTSTLMTSRETVSNLTTFTLRAFKDIWNKAFEPDDAAMSYWLAPLKSMTISASPEDLIDWSALKMVTENEEIPWTAQTSHESLKDRFLVDKYDGGRRFFTIHVLPDMKATDPVPADAVKVDKYSDSILSYSNRLWKRARAAKEAQWDLNQPVILADQMLHRQNLLHENVEKETATNTKAYICPQPMRISPLSPQIVAMLLIFPPVIHRIESYLIALEAFTMLGLNVGAELALEAITKDCDNSGAHNDQKVNFQQGMGANYERLEFLGDCFLKMATSIPLYGLDTNSNEESLHIERMLMLCNVNLFNHALELDLTKYVRSQPYSRRTWYPEGLNLLSGKSVNIAPEDANHFLGDKTVADVCEAGIGAAFLQHNIVDEWNPDNWTEAIKAVTKFVVNPKHTALKWDDYKNGFTMPAYCLSPASAVQVDMVEKIAKLDEYTFRHPKLLRTAFTHPSIPTSWEGVPSYIPFTLAETIRQQSYSQTLEFLGDSLLDLACVTFMFYRHPTRDPQWLTEHKGPMVDNAFFGALCIKLGFHKFLLHNNPALESAITTYRLEVEHAQAQSNGSPDYWIGIKKTPKCLPDIVEAYVGAMFIDSGFDYGQVLRFFNAHIAPYFQDLSIFDNYAKDHPVTRFVELVSVGMGCTDFQMDTSDFPTDPGMAKRYIAMVMVHGQVVAHSIGESGRYAKPRACTLAMDRMKHLPPHEFRKKFHCDCRVDGDGDVEMGGGFGMVEGRGIEA